MAISLSEQLESDIKEYLHKTFGTYFSSLDERFAADIKEDVINASDFHHGYYNDDDISIAFQRVTLGRMGHPDWQIYHSCTDTEVNTMKQNVKVNTPIHIRPASPEEAGLFYSELDETADERLGTVGHVRMDFGSSGKGFYHTWWPHNDDQFNTEEFKGELQEVVDALRADGPLKDLASMRSYCYRNGGGAYRGWPVLWLCRGHRALPLLPPLHPFPWRLPGLPLLLRSAPAADGPRQTGRPGDLRRWQPDGLHRRAGISPVHPGGTAPASGHGLPL